MIFQCLTRQSGQLPGFGIPLDLTIPGISLKLEKPVPELCQFLGIELLNLPFQGIHDAHVYQPIYLRSRHVLTAPLIA